MTSGKILIVEDEKDLRDVYELILTHSGYEVAVATNGAEALNAVNEYNPSLVLLDIFMPVMDGKTFLEKLDISNYPDLTVIVCSNTSDKNLMDEMLKLGAQKVVTKADLAPNDLTTLVEPYFAS
jgi:CheY-like chemotaxis protein